MRNEKRVAVIIPARNEEAAIARVIADIPPWVDEVVVADNGSRDATASRALAAGARVVHERVPGYGAACLAGIAAVGAADIIVFLDGDYSDYPAQMERLVDPVACGKADLVIGSRVLGKARAGSLTPQQRFGNALATLLIRFVWGMRYTDLGPFRAISAAGLIRLEMADRDFGWTVEMQIRAIEEGLRITEVPVSYRSRIGSSKISGTIKGSVLAGSKILYVIARHAARSTARPARASGEQRPAAARRSAR